METILFTIVVLIISAVAHEMAHGYAADYLGDPTPRIQGRLTLNPLKHLDPIGSFLVPLMVYASTYSMGGFIFGWAKPVEFNPYNLKNPRRDEMIIAVAGPLTNAVIAIVFGILIRFSADLGLSVAMVTLAAMVVIINLSLMIFNLMPIPPLDGSKILLNLLPDRYHVIKEILVRNSLIIFIAFLFFGSKFIIPIIGYLFYLITGFSF